jgi:UrcA family protein
MNSKNLAIGIASMALLAATVCATPATAQTPTELETIRVIAPSIIYRQEHQSGTAMPPGRVAEKSALVKFDDLDLKLSGDQRVLHERIAMTAQELCKDLAREVPKGSPSLPACTDQAIEESQAQVRQAVHLHSMRK